MHFYLWTYGATERSKYAPVADNFNDDLKMNTYNTDSLL